MSVASKCINCGQRRSCIKIEARAPLAHGPVLTWSARAQTHERLDYETSVPMIEICRECLREDRGTVASYLLESL